MATTRPPFRRRRDDSTVKVTTIRWLLAPVSSWRAWRLGAAFHGQVSPQTAWLLARTYDHPDELPYAQRALTQQHTAPGHEHPGDSANQQN